MLIDSTIETIDRYQSGNLVLDLTEITDSEDFDYDDQNTDYFSVGKKVRIDLADMDYVSWKRKLEKDAENLELLSLMIADITPEHDTKLQTLFDLIRKKIEHSLNPGNRKIIIFTAFSDTADYLYANVSKFAKEKFGLETAEITGTVDGKTTIPKLRADLNTVLTCFSPVSKGKSALMPGSKDELDILIATDCISEGQNLQDCDYLINAEEKGDLEYRRAQLKRLQEEVVDIEDMGSGISIMDLGLNEFRLDLLEYIKHHEEIETAPKGLHTVVSQTEEAPAGVIFVLRNINDSVNIDSLFKSGGTTALLSAVSGLDDFELICFLVVK